MKQGMKASTLAAAMGLVLTAPLWAQTPTTSQEAKQEMQQQKQDPLTMQESAPVDWNMIKGHEKGYVAMDEAAPNSWLAANFKPCDQNSDGKVTQAEYDQCRKKH